MGYLCDLTGWGDGETACTGRCDEESHGRVWITPGEAPLFLFHLFEVSEVVEETGERQEKDGGQRFGDRRAMARWSGILEVGVGAHPILPAVELRHDECSTTGSFSVLLSFC